MITSWATGRRTFRLVTESGDVRRYYTGGSHAGCRARGAAIWFLTAAASRRLGLPEVTVTVRRRCPARAAAASEVPLVDSSDSDSAAASQSRVGRSEALEVPGPACQRAGGPGIIESGPAGSVTVYSRLGLGPNRLGFIMLKF